MAESNSKACRRCGEVKLFSAFANNATKHDGLQTWCRLCKVDAQRATRSVKPPNPISCSSKVCSTCKEVLPSSSFGKCSSAADGLQVQCRTCKAEAHKLNYVPHPIPLKVKVQKPVKVKPVYQDGHKRCPKCAGVKPFDGFYKNANRVDGLNTWCKPCQSEKNKGFRNGKIFTGLIAESKTCQKCDVEKNISEFYRHKRDGVQPWCKTCFKSNKAAFQVKKREHATRTRKEKNCIQCNTTKPISEFRRSRRCVDSRSLRCLECDAKSLVHAKKTKNISQREREYVMENAKPVWADNKAIKAVYRAARLLEAKDGVKRHVDHIVPVRHKLVCGLHVASNLQILTDRENLKKGNKFEIQ